MPRQAVGSRSPETRSVASATPLSLGLLSHVSRRSYRDIRSRTNAVVRNIKKGNPRKGRLSVIGLFLSHIAYKKG